MMSCAVLYMKICNKQIHVYKKSSVLNDKLTIAIQECSKQD